MSQISLDTSDTIPREAFREKIARIKELEAENARLSLENQSLREKIVAAGYMPNHDAEEIRKSNDALKELMKYRLSEAVEMMAENERLTAALVECQEAFESGRAVGERTAETNRGGNSA